MLSGMFSSAARQPEKLDLEMQNSQQEDAPSAGLFDLIQTIPQGPQGVPGPPGTSVTGAVVDGVSADPATASASFDGRRS
jgi:hypothetical protein